MPGGVAEVAGGRLDDGAVGAEHDLLDARRSAPSRRAPACRRTRSRRRSSGSAVRHGGAAATGEALAREAARSPASIANTTRSSGWAVPALGEEREPGALHLEHVARERRPPRRRGGIVVPGRPVAGRRPGMDEERRAALARAGRAPGRSSSSAVRRRDRARGHRQPDEARVEHAVDVVAVRRRRARSRPRPRKRGGSSADALLVGVEQERSASRRAGASMPSGRRQRDDRDGRRRRGRALPGAARPQSCRRRPWPATRPAVEHEAAVARRAKGAESAAASASTRRLGPEMLMDVVAFRQTRASPSS